MAALVADPLAWEPSGWQPYRAVMIWRLTDQTRMLTDEYRSKTRDQPARAGAHASREPWESKLLPAGPDRERLVKASNFKNNRKGIVEKARATTRFLQRKAEYEDNQREIENLKQE